MAATYDPVTLRVLTHSFADAETVSHQGTAAMLLAQRARDTPCGDLESCDDNRSYSPAQIAVCAVRMLQRSCVR